jgi:hypothetical protein
LTARSWMVAGDDSLACMAEIFSVLCIIQTREIII